MFNSVVTKPTTTNSTEAEWNGELKVCNNHIYFYQDVSPKSVMELSIALRNLNDQIISMTQELGLRESALIHLHINSGGGCALSGLAAASHILQSQIPVITYVEGQSCSAATFMSCAGAQRYITEHSFMLIHQVSSMVWGSYQKIRDEKESLDAIMQMLEGIYLKYTKIKKKELKKLLKRDLYLNPTQCKALGLVDEVIEYKRG